MSKNKRKFVTPQQMSLPFGIEKHVEDVVKSTQELQNTFYKEPQRFVTTNDFEACIAVASATKHAITEVGLSREQIVDRINRYFGRTKKGCKGNNPVCFKPLTISMLNNYLGKPLEYKLPAYLIFAINEITKSLIIPETFVKAMGGEVLRAEEIKSHTLIKLQKNIDEMQKLKKQISKI
jgi:hypothetical protein